MKNTSKLFNEYINLKDSFTLANIPLKDATMLLSEATFPLLAGNKKMEYKVTIGNLEYLNTNIYGIKIENSLAKDNKFSIGNAIAQKATVSLKVGAETIPKMANVNVYVRYNGDLGPSNWEQFGSYFIDTRTKKGSKLTLICYDNMLKAEKLFVQSDQVDDYPMLQVVALNTICSRIGATLDNTGISNTYTIDYPNERTMRELLMDIACSNCGNFIIVNNVLKLIKPSNGIGRTFNYKGFEEINDKLQFTRVTMYYNDNDYFTAGNDTKDELIVRNNNATQVICNNVLEQLNMYIHRPFKLKSAYLNPLYELGDTIRVNNIDYQIWNYILTFTGAGLRYTSVKSPGESAIEHEYPYEGQYSRAIKKRVQLNKAYFGVNISRKKGLYIAMTDNSSDATFNSEKIELRAKVNNVLTPVFYFDSIKRKFKMTAEVEIESVDILTGKVTTLESNVDGISLKIKDVKGNISTINQTISSINQTISDAKGNISNLSQTVKGINTTVTSVKGNVSKLTQKVNSFETKLTDVTGNISTLEQTVNSFSTKIQDTEDNISELTQSVNGFSAVVNSTKVTITEGNGITVKNGGFRIINSSDKEVFGITSNGYIKQLGEFYNACGRNAVRIYDGTIEIAAQASGSIPVAGGSVVGSIGGEYTYFTKVLKINAKETFKLTTDHDDDLFYEMKISSYNDYRGSKYHNFRGTVVFHTKPFTKVKRFNDINDDDLILVSEYQY